ncbi:hypothetical protein C8Q79DRAFT_637779 [Trametes meyenii]|nr:hypothetical protein C8Q79DRAFT_637779 [Trametes meyenii]
MDSIGVIHRDPFRSRFLPEWFPESKVDRQFTISCPRVYLDDFETAAYFSQDNPSHVPSLVGLPRGLTHLLSPLEIISSRPYDLKFKLNLQWEFGKNLVNLGVRCP